MVKRHRHRPSSDHEEGGGKTSEPRTVCPCSLSLSLLFKNGDGANRNRPGQVMAHTVRHTVRKARRQRASRHVLNRNPPSLRRRAVERALVNRSHKTGFSGETLGGGGCQPLRIVRHCGSPQGWHPFMQEAQPSGKATNGDECCASGPTG